MSNLSDGGRLEPTPTRSDNSNTVPNPELHPRANFTTSESSEYVNNELLRPGVPLEKRETNASSVYSDNNLTPQMSNVSQSQTEGTDVTDIGRGSNADVSPEKTPIQQEYTSLISGEPGETEKEKEKAVEEPKKEEVPTIAHDDTPKAEDLDREEKPTTSGEAPKLPVGDFFAAVQSTFPDSATNQAISPNVLASITSSNDNAEAWSKSAFASIGGVQVVTPGKEVPSTSLDEETSNPQINEQKADETVPEALEKFDSHQGDKKDPETMSTMAVKDAPMVMHEESSTKPAESEQISEKTVEVPLAVPSQTADEEPISPSRPEHLTRGDTSATIELMKRIPGAFNESQVNTPQTETVPDIPERAEGRP